MNSLNVTEELLNYLWKFQKFNKNSLETEQGESLIINHQGMPNDNAGPDFINSELMINSIKLFGSVEVHVNASDWISHKHHKDKNYDKVVLHVIWNNNAEIRNSKDIPLPTLNLKNYITQDAIYAYKSLMDSQTDLVCENYFDQINQIDKISMLEKALFQRLTKKNLFIYELLKFNKSDWEETTFQLLAMNFGFKVNSDNFLNLCQQISYKLLRKHINNLEDLETILFGFSGMIPEITDESDEYNLKLYNKFNYLKTKYKFNKSQVFAHQWNFFRLRPANFPTIRIAQLAAFILGKQNLFDLLINETVKNLVKIFYITQSEYWTSHYKFNKIAKKPISGIGKRSVESILINSVAQLLIAYGKYKDKQEYIDKAINILQSLPAEQNHIINKWLKLGCRVDNAFDSQGYLELYNNYCVKHQCLKCNIGCKIIENKISKFNSTRIESTM